MCILTAESRDDQEQGSDEVFCGSVKSFNARRGFGFLSCEETASRFGRDVYLSKEETMVLAAEPDVGQEAAHDIDTTDKDQTKAPAPVQEGEILLFHVKLSTEGFPQAVQVKKMRRLRGFVQQVPSSAADGIIVVTGDGSDKPEVFRQNTDAAIEQLLGAEVKLRQSECGQLKLMPNDEIAFCCVSASDSSSQAWDAQLIDLISTPRDAGSLLGCFSLQLPRLMNDSVAFSTVELEGHAVTDCVFLSKVPSHLGAPDLMRLFSQLGGNEAKVTLGNGSDKLGHASITFNGAAHVAKLLVQTTHTMSENGITKLAHVGPCLHRTSGSMECFCGCQDRAGSMENAHLSMARHNLPACLQADNGNNQQDIRQTMPAPLCTRCPAPEAGTHMPEYDLISAVFPAPNQFPQVQVSINCVPPQVMAGTPLISGAPAMPDWRCIHRNILVPAAAPEMLGAADDGCSLCIQWPTVVHAKAYSVEILNQNTMTVQRYVHAMPEGPLPFVMDLRLDNMQPSQYAASVRCIAPCGCESSSSPWSIALIASVAPMAPALHLLQPITAAVVPCMVPQSCPPPPSAPPSFPATATMLHSSALPPVPEESLEAAGISSDDILTLD